MPAGGTFKLISTQTGNGSATTVSWTGLSGYDIYWLTWNASVVLTDAQTTVVGMRIVLNSNTNSIYLPGTYTSQTNSAGSATYNYSYFSSDEAFFRAGQVTHSATGFTNNWASGESFLFFARDTSGNTPKAALTWSGYSRSNTNDRTNAYSGTLGAGGMNIPSTAITSITVSNDYASAFKSGSLFSLYGITNA
jgi:hypothetical protein